MRRACIAWLSAALLLPLAAPAQTIAITGGRIHTVSSAGVIDGGTLLIRDGRILAIGKNLEIPAGATRIDASGRWVTPGIFNAYTQLGLVEVEGVPSTIDNEAATAPFSAAFDVAAGVNGESTLLPIARTRGVTRAAIFPVATRSVFGGLGALIQLGDGLAPVFDSHTMMLVELGARGASLGGGARGAALSQVHAMLDSAKDARAPDADARALRRVLSGEVPLVAHVERAADILNVLALRQRYPALRPVLLGASEGWRVAQQIAAAKVPALLDSFANVPLDFESMAATQENAGRLAKAGVLIAIAPLYRFHAATPHNAGLVTQYAGNAVGHGLPWDVALQAITINPARIFGVDDRLGSLEPGKIADIVVWSGDPLELDGRPEAVLIAGKSLPLVSRQTQLRDRYRDLSRPGYSYRH